MHMTLSDYHQRISQLLSRFDQRLSNIETIVGQMHAPSPRALQPHETTTPQVDSLQQELAQLRERLAVLEQHHDNDTAYAHILSQLLHTIFAEDVQIKQAAHALLNTLLAEHAPNPETIRTLHQMQGQLEDVAGELAGILQLSEALHSPTANRIAQARQKVTTVLEELQMHERYCLDRHIELHVPLSLKAGTSYGVIESVAWAIRDASRKILDPVGYFTERIDRLVTVDLVMVIDLCDALDEARMSQLGERILRLMARANLQDISPEVGKSFDPRHQELIGFRDGAPRDAILDVRRRGLCYKERRIRKATVVIGR